MNEPGKSIIAIALVAAGIWLMNLNVVDSVGLGLFVLGFAVMLMKR